MIILLNGVTGIGKTAAARRLLPYLERAVLLDGETLCTVHPDGPGTAEYRARTLRHLLAFHLDNGYPNFVVADRYLEAGPLRELRRRIAEVDDEIHTFRLTASEATVRRRLIQAQAADVEAGVRRYRHESEAIDAAARGADMGLPVDTSALAPAQVAEAIWQNVREEVTISPYHPNWPEAFEAEGRRIAQVLGRLALEIHHIGSTAVPGLAAKPILDIMVVVRDLTDALLCIEPLRQIDYSFVDYPQNVDRRFFRKGFPRTHHLHIVAEGSRTLDDHLDFRDALRTRPEIRERYERLKSDLARQFSGDRVRYSSAKGRFVDDTLRDHRGLPVHPLP